MISNILENAVDSVQNAQKPEVTVITQQQDAENLLIQIRDNGSGMHPDVMEHIFDPFFSTKPVGQGTGMGLAICRSIAKSHHGSIKATSVASQGSEVSIILPLKSEGSVE